MADDDRKSHEPKPISRKETFPPDDQYSHRHWANTHRVNSVEIQSSANFLSANSGGQISISSSSSLSNENPSSTAVTGENLKDYVVSTQSSNFVPCRVHVSSRSDVTLETGPLVHRGGCGLDAVKSNGRQKYTTESSCSNSIQITLPVSSSNESYLEMSTEMRSAKPRSHGARTSSAAGFGTSTEEPVTRGTVSEIGGRSSKEVVDIGREDTELKVSGLVRKQNVFSISSLHKHSVNGVGQNEQFHDLDHALGTASNCATGTAEEISICRAASDDSLNKECNGPAVNERFLHLGDSGKSSCLTETEEPVATFSKKCEGRGSSYLDILDQELMKQQPFSNLQHPPKVPHPLRLYEPSGLSNGDKSTLVSAKDPDLFDLNENSKEFNSYVQSTRETANPFNVIRVLAKPGVPSSILMTSQKPEGEMSWRGSAATSAFRPTKLKTRASQSSCAATVSKGFAGFDLNVPATADDAESELHLGVGSILNPLTLDPSSEVKCSKAERIDFDLNCVGDMFQGTALPATSVKTEIVDFNLNEGSSTVDKYDDGHWRNKPSQRIEKVPFNSPGISFTTSSGGHGLNVIRPAYWSDFSNVQFYSQSQIQPFLMTSSNALQPVEQLQKVQLQPKLPYVIPSLPPQSYPPSGPVFICPNGLVASNIHYPGHVQYSGDPRVHAAFPQRIGHPTVPSTSRGPHFMQTVRANGRSQNEVANLKPRTDVVNGGISAFNGGPRDTRQLFPLNCPSYEEQMRVPPKRTEPEGGHELQLRTRQLTSWK